MHGFLQTLGECLKIPTGETPVGGEAFGHDQQVATTLGNVVVVERQPSTDVAEGILLRAHGHTVGERGDLSYDVCNLAPRLTLLALVDEPRVLGKPACVEE